MSSVVQVQTRIDGPGGGTVHQPYSGFGQTVELRELDEGAQG